MAHLSDAEKGDNLKKKNVSKSKVRTAHCTAHNIVRGKAHFWEAPGCAGLVRCPRGSFSSCRATAFTPSTDILHNWSKKTIMIIFYLQLQLQLADCNGTKRGRVNWIGLDNDRTWVQYKRYKYTDFSIWAFDALIWRYLFSNIVYIIYTSDYCIFEAVLLNCLDVFFSVRHYLALAPNNREGDQSRRGEDAPNFNGSRKFYIQPASTKFSGEREYHKFLLWLLKHLC